MKSILQSKFQVTPAENRNEERDTWVTDKSARAKKGLPGREGRSGGDHESKAMNNAVLFNSTPPGMDLEDQEVTDQRRFPMRMSSEGDVTPDYSRKALKDGYTAHDCCPTDDQYTNEHRDCFYDEITVDGVTGFCERGNVLDRN